MTVGSLLKCCTCKYDQEGSQRGHIYLTMEFTPEEGEQLLEAFKALGVKPKADTPEETEETEVDSGKVLQGKTHGLATVNPQWPRLSTFSGDDSNITDASFDLWRYEVTCVLEGKLHPKETVRQAIRRSLRGQAARVAMHLGPTANSTDILKKLEGVYGSVEVGQTLLSEFYAARQKKGEDVVSWGCHLEDLMDRAQRQGLVPEREANEMLRAQFWANLNQKLKDSSIHKLDTIKDFDALRVEIRCIEREYKNAETEEVSEGNKSKPATQSQRAAASITEGPPTHEQESVNELKGIVSQMTNQLASMQQQMHVMGQMQQRPVYPNFPPPPSQYNPLPQLRNPGSVEPSRFQMGTQGISQDVRQSAMGGGGAERPEARWDAG